MALLKSLNNKRSLEYSKTDKSIYFNIASKDESTDKSILISNKSRRVVTKPVKANY